ncbi:hypothetical protein C0992_004031 [Termitomyces sp. T32_za158]|nr:hypothetical protein C0992_004031 [Termitomyces sp. T32_za158]
MQSLSAITTDKTPEERAKLLETTPLFANIHTEAASGGQTQVPTDLDTDFHFTCFVPAPALRGPKSPGGYRILELDGRRAGPVDRGECEGEFLQVSRHSHFIKYHGFNVPLSGGGKGRQRKLSCKYFEYAV